MKKLYYLIKNDDVPRNPYQPDKKPSLSECIFAFDCLKTLKDTEDEAKQKYEIYLEMLRQWRNDEAHLSPNATENEVNAALKVVSTMYLYVIAHNITELEIAGVL